MSEFFQEIGDKHRITFEDSQWCDVKQELSQGDQDYILTQMASMDGTPHIKALGHIWLLERSILAWSFPLPVTSENISNLRQKYRTKVLQEVNRLNEEATSFVRKNS